VDMRKQFSGWDRDPLLRNVQAGCGVSSVSCVVVTAVTSRHHEVNHSLPSGTDFKTAQSCSTISNCHSV
jgi:hypothetical protein